MRHTDLHVGIGGQLFNENGSLVAVQGDGEEIVRRWNAHEDLLEALELLIAEASQGGTSAYAKERGRDAIAKARGGK